MVFGRLEQSLHAARRLHRRHAAISGTMQLAAGPFPAGSFYCANCVPALRWVHATLTETALMAYTIVLPALTPEERERYYAESRLFAALFGIPQASLPEGWAAFSAYTEAMAQSDTLTVTDLARAMAHRLLAGSDTWFPIPASYRALTAELLPPPLREAFALRYDKAERRAVQNLIGWARRIIRSYPLGCATLDPIRRLNNGLQEGCSPTLQRSCPTTFGSDGATCRDERLMSSS